MSRRAASEAVVEAGWRFNLGGFETWGAGTGDQRGVGIATIAGQPLAMPGSASISGRTAYGCGSRTRRPAGETTGGRRGSGDYRPTAASTATTPARDPGRTSMARTGPRHSRRRPHQALLAPSWTMSTALTATWSTRGPRAVGGSKAMDHPRPQRNRIHFDITVPARAGADAHRRQPGHGWPPAEHRICALLLGARRPRGQ